MKNEADLLVHYTEREAKKSRQRFMATLAEIRRRADPRVIAAESAENLLGRVNQMLSNVGTTARSRPVLSLGGGAAFMVAVALRIWLAKSKDKSDAT